MSSNQTVALHTVDVEGFCLRVHPCQWQHCGGARGATYSAQLVIFFFVSTIIVNTVEPLYNFNIKTLSVRTPSV